MLLKAGLGILVFYNFDWLKEARLSAHKNLLRPNMVNEHSTAK